MNPRILSCLAFAISTSLGSLLAGDWPQYLGPNSNGVVPSESINSDWSKKEPTVLWEKSIGMGCSSFSISNGKAITLGNIDDKDILWCFDAITGNEVWKFEYDEELAPQSYEGGTTSTPTIDGNRVYIISRSGKLHCLALESGKLLWQRDYLEDFNGRKGGWGYTASPFIYGDLLIGDPGAEDGAIVALDKMTGETKWKAGNNKPGYATPVIYKHEGTTSLAVFHSDKLVGYSLDNPGEELFQYNWESNYGVNASNPHYDNGRIFFGSGFNLGYALINITKSVPEIVHRNREYNFFFQNSLVIDGDIIAVFGSSQVAVGLVRMNLESGVTLWKKEMPSNMGFTIATGNELIILNENGSLTVGKATKEGFEEYGTKDFVGDKASSIPALSNGLVYFRDIQGKAVCVDLRM